MNRTYDDTELYYVPPPEPQQTYCPPQSPQRAGVLLELVGQVSVKQRPRRAVPGEETAATADRPSRRLRRATAR